MKTTTFLSKPAYDTLLDAGVHMVDGFIQAANHGRLDVTRFPKYVPYSNLRLLNVIDAGYAEYLKFTDSWPARNVTCSKICLDYAKTYLV